jgi:DNA-binding SARP family transcriptional activator
MRNYHGMYAPKLNVEEGLRATREAYDADGAFLLEMDADSGVFGVIEATTIEDITGLESIVVDRRIGKNLFNGLILPGETAIFILNAMKASHHAEYEWMLHNGIEELMVYPVRTRAEFIGFLGVCNPKRFNESLDMLELASVMLIGELRAMLVMGKMTLERTRSKILEDNDVLLNLFGGFEVRTNMGKMMYGDFSSSQCCVMLIYLLINRKRIVPVREIAEILWPDQLFDNPYGMVKGVAFRLRKLLSPICEKPIVIAKQRTYAINEELNIMIDTDNFENTCATLTKKDLSTEEKFTLYRRAINIYKGDLLPNFENEIWLLGQISYFQMKYWNIMKCYLILLDEAGRYEEFFAVVSGAMNAVYADGDVYALIISVLVKQNRLEMARSCYMKAERLLTPEQRREFVSLWHDKMSAK